MDNKDKLHLNFQAQEFKPKGYVLNYYFIN